MPPLAEKLRPSQLEDVVGHSEVLSEGKPLYEAIKNDRLFSFLLYAPPGVGKTTIARLIRHYTKARCVALSAVTSGIKEVKACIEEAKFWKQKDDRDTVVFIDELHRFNKAQQDALLPSVENGEIILIGATTEHPSYEINAALLSRLRVIQLDRLTETDIVKILEKASTTLELQTTPRSAIDLIAAQTHGDARTALHIFELSAPDFSLSKIKSFLQGRMLIYDKAGDQHYQIASAFIKSMRAGRSEEALYYLARMWEGGEDPLFIARRMIIFASEDIGNADLRAIALANAVKNAVEFVGRPECYYALSQGVIYLSKATKSREAGDLFQIALNRVKKEGASQVPISLTNNPQLN